MEHVFKIKAKEANQGGYYALKKKTHNVLYEKFPGFKFKVDRGFAIVKLYSDRNESQVYQDFKFIIDNATPSWAIGGFGIESITEPRAEKIVLTNSIRQIGRSLDVVVEQLKEALATTQHNEEQCISDYVELDDKYRNLFEQNQEYAQRIVGLENVVKRYERERKDVPELREEIMGLKRKLKQIEVISRKPIGKKSRIETKLDYIREAIAEENHSKGQIWRYIIDNNIDIKRTYLPYLLNEGVERKKFKKPKKNYYEL